MDGANLILSSYQNSLRSAMDVIANNVANVNTTGFKRETVAFDSYLMQPTPQDSFRFAVDKGTYRDGAQGATLMTGNPLDVAIQGRGYFSIETEAGVRYSRSGAFLLNSEGEMVTPAGDRLLGDGDQVLTLPPDAYDILVGPDGTITAATGAGGDAVQIGRISLVYFENERDLRPVGNGLYTSTSLGVPDEESRLMQGAVEQSNVQAIAEMTRMIEVSRRYQTVVRLLDRENERLSSAIQRLGKVTA